MNLGPDYIHPPDMCCGVQQSRTVKQWDTKDKHGINVMASTGQQAPGRNPWGNSTATHHSVRLDEYGTLFYCKRK